MRRSTILRATALLLYIPLAAAQTTLGELLDAGATVVTVEDFKRDIVQHVVVAPSPPTTTVVVGPSSIVGPMEIVYRIEGTVYGERRGGGVGMLISDVFGEWSVDDRARICTRIEFRGYAGGGSALFPRRCQFWFKHRDAYYAVDSNVDRAANADRIVVKATVAADPRAVAAAARRETPPPDPGPTMRSLGELLDAGGKLLSGAEFRDLIVQREIVGPMASGVEFKLMYTQIGTVQGKGSLIPTPMMVSNAPVSGEWMVDDKQRVCTSMRVNAPTGATTILPARCQFWFKVGDQYYVSDSDFDRSAKLLVRTIAQ